MDNRIAAWITGIGAVLFALAGVALVIREVRRKERLDALETITTMERIMLVQQNEAVAWHSYVYALRVLCADKGIATPEPPPIADLNVRSDSLLSDVGDVGRRNRWLGRGRRKQRRDNDPVNDDTVEFPAVNDDDDGLVAW